MHSATEFLSAIAIPAMFMQTTLHIAIMNVNLNAPRKLLFPVKISMKFLIPINEIFEDTPFQSVNE